MCRHRPILQTLRNVQPAKSVFVQHERRVARDSRESGFVSSWAKPRRLIRDKIRDIDAGPLALPLVPPDQFLAIAPWLTGRFRAGSIIYNTAIGRPDEPPTMP